jgi:hypothetical protein
MKIHVSATATALTAAALLAVTFAREGRVAAQTSAATPVPTSVPSGPTPRMPDGKPDLQGVWQRPYVPDMSRSGRGQKGHAERPFSPEDTPEVRASLRQRGEYGDLPYTAAGLQAWKSYDIANLNAPDGPGDYTGNCFPFGMARSINSPEPMQIMQNSKYLALLFEQNSWFHIVPLDGRDHPKGDALNPTWFGNSVGKWDGDTLIIDTVGFNGYTRLDTNGHPHSDQLHLIQTFRRTDMGHIEHTITVDDPKFYSKPWKNERTFTLMNAEILEYSCEENNRSLWEGRLKVWLPPWAQKK